MYSDSKPALLLLDLNVLIYLISRTKICVLRINCTYIEKGKNNLLVTWPRSYIYAGFPNNRSVLLLNSSWMVSRWSPNFSLVFTGESPSGLGAEDVFSQLFQRLWWSLVPLSISQWFSQSTSSSWYLTLGFTVESQSGLWAEAEFLLDQHRVSRSSPLRKLSSRSWSWVRCPCVPARC